MSNKVKKEIFNVVSENVKALAQLFPSAVKDGEVDFDALKTELGEFTEVGTEKYDFTWFGKSKAKAEANADILGRTLKLKPGEGVNEDTTQNIYIEGDNLEALKLLRNSYYGKIKMIYIDPPYNTGNDNFVYPDNFSTDKKELDEKTGEIEEGFRVVKNTKDNSQYHTEWLNIMYPRLRLARDLLTDDGVIFISIDDNEMRNLKNTCDEVFGDNNFIGLMTIQSNPRGSQSSKHLSSVHEYIMMYSKSESELELKGIAKSEESELDYNETDSNGRKYRLLGLRQRGGAWRKEQRPLLHYPIYINPTNGDVSLSQCESFSIKVIPARPTGELGRWTWGKEKFEKCRSQVVGKKVNRSGDMEAWDIFRKDYIDNDDGSEKTAKIKTIWVEKEINYQNAKNEIKELFGKSDIFDYPKPTYIVRQLADMLFYNNDEEFTILDFFSGSATTAHAIMQLNAEDGGKRKFIMVQVPEPTKEDSEAFKAGYKYICEIGKERIRRAGAKIAEENQMTAPNLDIGFKVFKVADTNIKMFTRELGGEKLLAGTQITSDDIVEQQEKFDFNHWFTDIDVCYELLLRHRGIPLSSKMEKLPMGERSYVIADSIVVCLDKSISETLVEQLAAIEPLPLKFIFRDSAFNDDISLKENTMNYLNTLIKKNNDKKNYTKTYRVEFI